MRREYGDVLAQMTERERSLAPARGRAAQCAPRAHRRGAQRGRAPAGAVRAPDVAGEHPSARPGVASQRPRAPAGDDDAAWTDYLRATGIARCASSKRCSGDAGDTFGDAVARRARRDHDRADDRRRAVRLRAAAADAVRGSMPRRRSAFAQTAARVLARLDACPTVRRCRRSSKRSRARSCSRRRSSARKRSPPQLRLAVQQAARRAATRSSAKRPKRSAMLEAMPDDAPAPLLRALEHVAAGVARLDDALRSAAQSVLDEAAADRERRGAVGRGDRAHGIAARPGLRGRRHRGHALRRRRHRALPARRLGELLRAPARRSGERTRSTSTSCARSGDEENAERRRQDALAEDRWCAEFPKLMAHARGARPEARRHATARRRRGAGAGRRRGELPAHRREEDDARAARGAARRARSRKLRRWTRRRAGSRTSRACCRSARSSCSPATSATAS